MLTIVRTILLIIYIIDCIGLSVVVLMQEGKQPGLSGALTGSFSDTYWAKNKGRSMEGGLVLATRIMGAIFIILSVVFNFSMFS